MRNIWCIFRDDVARTTSNAIGLLVLVGLVVVPSLYAWFNIAGSWDPYESTDRLKVAVANNDEGYESDLVPLEVNIGSTVVASLHENDDFDWVFTDEDSAVDGVRSGEFYASIVIPTSFSADMMTLFSADVKHASIVYYTNEKENPIAPHVTDKGADAIQKQIDGTFVSTVNEAGLKTATSLIDFMGSDGVGNYAAVLARSVDRSIGSVEEAARQATAFASLMGAIASLTDSTSELLAKSGGGSSSAQGALSETQSGVDEARAALEGAAAAVDEALRQSASGFDGVSASIDEAFGAIEGNAGDASSSLSEVSAEVGGFIQVYKDLRLALLQVDPTPIEPRDSASASTATAVADEPGSTDPVDPEDPGSSGLAPVIAHLEQTIALLETLQQAVDEAARDAGTAGGTMVQDREDIKALVAEAKSSILAVDVGSTDGLSSQLGSLSEALGSVGWSAAGVSDELDGAAASLSSASGSVASELSNVQAQLVRASDKLVEAASGLRDVKRELDAALTSGDLERVRQIIGSNPESMAELLASPVELERHTVYPIENNGSSMAAFYTILSIWVGSTILAAMMKTGLSERRLREMGAVKPHQLYIGRFGLFAVLALLQSTLVCLGDLFFLGIQCEHPLLFMLAGWVAGFVFCNLIYTLTVSFGDVGKAIAVVLLVMQVAGSGGTFPIEMTSQFFQSVYPFLPFTHGIDAMHACIGGIYGNEYWVSLGKLVLFLVPSLLLGLVLRKPVMRANAFVTEKLEETKLM